MLNPTPTNIFETDTLEIGAGQRLSIPPLNKKEKNVNISVEMVGKRLLVLKKGFPPWITSSFL